MKISMKHRLVFVFVIILLVSVIAVMVNGADRKKNLTIEIDSTQVSYIRAYCLGMGPRIVWMDDDPEVLNKLFSMLNGEYSFYDEWKAPEVDGGGPYSVEIYDENQDEIMGVRFLDHLIYVVHREGKSYYRYENTEYTLDFSFFYEFLSAK